jgi:hypothetical protein
MRFASGVRVAGWAALVLTGAATALGGEIPNGVEAFAAARPASMQKTTAPKSLPNLPNGPAAFAPRIIKPIDVRALTAAIDRLIAAKWAAVGVSPTPEADDDEFLRRVSLDVAGRIPTASEARAFLDDRDPDKRRKLVDRLLAGPAFANHMTEVWKELLLPEAAGSFQIAFFAEDFGLWLRKQVAEGVPYDAFVRALLTVPMSNRLPFQRQAGDDSKPTAFAFLAAKDGKPENLAASASRLFLGVRIECAQCHNHPFAKWKREEFWGMAAFFSGIKRQGDGDNFFQGTESPDKHEIEIPGTKKVVQASFLDGRDVTFAKGVASRKVLADWLTSRENPYFARAAVNRIWSQFFGSGLVDPIDDFGSSAEPSHPELLDLLADQFAAHDFDVRYVVRALTASRAYQLSSVGGSPSSDTYRAFDRMPVRGLSPVQLYDSLIQATGLSREAPQPPFVIGGDSPRRDFLERFAASAEEKPTDRQTSILQALTLMNGRLLTDATSPGTGATLPAVADSYFLDTAGKVEALYLATLSRKPRPDELDRLVPYIDRGGPTLNPKKALADVFWSLLGSAEFVLNH